VRPVAERLQQRGAADGVDVDVVADLVHRLADADGRGEVIDGVTALEGARARLDVADVAAHELGPGVQVARAIDLAVDLGIEVAQDPDLVPEPEERVHEMGTNEPCAARDENST
jgi:hypothetical protein